MPTKDTAKLSAKFQICIPKAVRTARHWQAGQEFAFIPRRGRPAGAGAEACGLSLAWRGAPNRRVIGIGRIAFTETCVVADLDTTIALAAADLCAGIGWQRRMPSSMPRR